MDFSSYVESIIENMKNAGYYSDIEESELRYRLEEYLRKEYNKMVEVAAFEYDIAQSKKDLHSIEDVKLKLSGIKREILYIVRELAKTEL